ncbi:hypothetical protein [Pseudoalteromonas sp. MMG005]|uniref:hypothetical protein n=1 Tax=Pseudoalteromonas sp. MMG005 TaxID=2822682 RepID=UPI001B3A5F68|nr:hypothetical protein [Pseudoalteromonas sp. MMG005]MBQ4845423.1 hypothetical protein [Pseudoalteromonas sp. MMG005]
MTKTQKKLEQQLIQLLTNACEELKAQLPEFEYLTHYGQMSKLKHTLKVELFCTNTLSGKQLSQSLGVINDEIKPMGLTLKAHDLLMTVQ